jgi:hypothetical protein
MIGNEVKCFLSEFKAKVTIYDNLLFLVREKNQETINELEISPLVRRKLIMSLEVEDYSEGPIKDGNYVRNELWVFGKFYRNRLIYIKLSLGVENSNPICLSFHIAEFAMSFPLK